MRLRFLFLVTFLSFFIFNGGLAQGLSPGTMEFYDNWGNPGFTVISQSASGLEIVYSLPRILITEVEVNGETYTNVTIPGTFLGNNEGAPNLPGASRFIAYPQGAGYSVEVLESRSSVFRDVNILPAPPIPREGDTTPPTYEKDTAIYNVDAGYPAQPVMSSEPMVLRGVNAFILGITPFTYNPVQKQLVVYSDFRLRISFQGGNGQFGEDRLRSRWFEPLLAQHLLNYASLSAVDFDSRPKARGEECEYMIFYPDDPDFEAWATTIRNYRANQGISSNIFNIADLGGTASDIEAKINDAYNNWSTAPVAILMLGDLPYMPVNTWDDYCLSDNIYADVNGDDLPEMNIARITARNAADLELMINKFMDYERTPPVNPSFYDEPLIAGGWQSDRWFILCCEVVWGFLHNEEGKNPVREYAGYTHGQAPSQWSTNPNTYMILEYFGPNGLGYVPATPAHLTDWNANATSINADINSGAFWLLHRDHGYESGWGDPDYSTSDLSGLYNDDHVFVLTINCLTGKYDYNPQCFAEAFQRMPHGALGTIAATQVSYSFVNDTFVWGIHDSMWPDFDPYYGVNPEESPLLPGFAQVSGKWYLAGHDWPYNPGEKDVTYHLFHMHGDAFTQICDQVPQDLTVSHADTIESSQTTFEVTADAGSFIAIAVDGTILGTAEGTGAPVTVHIAPLGQPGQIMCVTVTKLNHRRYEGPVLVVTGGPLAIWLPNGTPTNCLPGPQTNIDLVIFDGTETYVPGSGLVYYRFDPSDPYESAPLTEVTDYLLIATIPGAFPMSQPAFYFSAEGNLGSIVYNPPDAPATTYTMEVGGLPQVLLIDNFEDDLGWSVENINVEAGAWERAIPVGSGGDRGDPPTDSDGSGTCYVTGNGFDEDLDEGPTILYSPMIDLAFGETEISFDRWFYNDDKDDPFTVSISSDGGSSWTVVDEKIGGNGGWELFSFSVNDYVTPSDQTQVRISTQDYRNTSVTEAGVDHFMIRGPLLDLSLWADAYSFTLSEGCNISLYLDAGPEYAGYKYIVAGGLSGDYPGTQLPGGLTIPLNRDWFTNYILAHPNSPMFVNFRGTLDGEGKAVANLVIGGGDDLTAQLMELRGLDNSDLTGVFAFTLPQTWDFVSNAVSIEVE